MVKASPDSSHADHGGFVINTGTGTSTSSSEAVIPAGAQPHHSPAASGALAALVSWFVISTGTNNMSATGSGAQIAGGAGSVIADGAPAVSTNCAGAVHNTGALAQPCRTAGASLSDQMLSASRFLYKTCADTTSVGGAGSDGPTAVNPHSAWAVNTTGALPQPWRAAGGAFPDHDLIPGSSRFVFKTGTDAINATERGAQIAAGAGSVVATGAATVKTSCAGAVSATGAPAQFSGTPARAFSEQMLFPGPFVFRTGTGRANASGLVINSGAGSVITIGPGAQIAGAGAVIAAGAAAVNTNNAGAVNVYEEVAVSRPTSTMIGIGMLGVVGMLGIGVIFSKNDAIKFVRAAAEEFSLKRKLRWWAARLLKKIKDD